MHVINIWHVIRSPCGIVCGFFEERLALGKNATKTGFLNYFEKFLSLILLKILIFQYKPEVIAEKALNQSYYRTILSDISLN